jgi:integrase
MKLTDLSVRALAVSAGQRTFFDDTFPGFGVRVPPRSKTFVVLVRRNNATRWETLGKYPEPLSLSEARKRARARLNGIVAMTAPMTFEEAVAEYRDRHLTRVRATTAHEQARILRVRFQPVFGKKRLDRWVSRDIAAVVDAIPGASSARAAFIAMRTLLNWCIKQDYLQISPLSRLDCPKSTERSRVLTDEELVRVWRGAPQSAYGDIVKLLILTGQRRGQIATMKPEFIQGAVITWRASGMKSNRVHSIPKTSTVAGILANYPQGIPTLAHWAWFKTKLDRSSGVTGWVLHDLRRTFATKLAEMGIALHVIERLLAHSAGSISGWLGRDEIVHSE